MVRWIVSFLSTQLIFLILLLSQAGILFLDIYKVSFSSIGSTDDGPVAYFYQIDIFEMFLIGLGFAGLIWSLMLVFRQYSTVGRIIRIGLTITLPMVYLGYLLIR